MKQWCSYLLAAVIGGLVTGGVLLVAQGYVTPQQSKMVAPTHILKLDNSTPEEAITTTIFQNNKDSVVHISSTKESQFEHPVPIIGTGTGFVIREDGYIITSHHVIEDSSSIEVTFSDGRRAKARLVGSDPLKDTAVIKVDMEGLSPVEIGDSGRLKPGQFVVVIGNPYKFDLTVTTGVISAVNRTLETQFGYRIEGVIQTDAAINPGNSGGPLLNSKGEVVGINSAIFTTTEGFQGIGFAIPINTAVKTANSLIDYGGVIRPAMGIVCADAGEEFLKSLNINQDGVLLMCVQPGSPLDRAGLRGTVSQPGSSDFQMGDIIIEVENKRVKTMGDMVDIIQQHSTGDKIQIRYIRGGKVKTATIELGSN